jgi:cardiolipin synthase
VRKASRSRWGDLLRAGVAIHEYQPTMFHCKVMIVDDRWVSVGSTNFDNRSFRLNDETNLNVYDREFAATQIAAFEEDKARSRRITLEEWESRPWTEKLVEHAAGLFRSQL